jgi:hypothetical protein
VRVRLEQIADLLTGLTPRQTPGSPVRAQSLRLLSLSDVSPSGEVVSSVPRWVEPSPAYRRYAVNPGDLLFRGRGGGFAAALVPDLGSEAAASAPLVIIRPGPEVDPAYLAWVLNSPAAHTHYARAARGSALPAIGATELAMLAIPLPPRDVQLRIAEIASLARQEAALEQKLIELRARRIDRVLQLAANDANGATLITPNSTPERERYP